MRGVRFERLRDKDDSESPFIEKLAIIANENIHNDILERFAPGDVLQPAMYYVQRQVNDYLKEKVSAQVLWTQDHNALELRFAPRGLLVALWLQFANAIERDSEFRRCAECGDWFEISPATARANKTYCSNACRTKAYRKRKAKAQSLFRDGLSVEEIAERLDANPSSITGWVHT